MTSHHIRADRAWNHVVCSVYAYEDIKAYLQSELQRLKTENGLSWVPSPIDSQIEALATKSSGNFIYATSVMQALRAAIESSSGSITRKLNKVLSLEGPSAMNALFESELQAVPEGEIDITKQILGVALWGNVTVRRAIPRLAGLIEVQEESTFFTSRCLTFSRTRANGLLTSP